jgi:hypothetical protein
MPTVTDALDVNRYREIAHDAQLGANLWISVGLAAQRGDKAALDAACDQLRTLTRATFALVKKLGSEDGSNG